ncbi:MAG: DUF3592 domain-containing protein [Chthoniobacterales bacterium]
MAETEPTTTSTVDFGLKSFILPVIGAVLLIIGFYFIWSEYSFQQERETESGLVLKKLSRKASRRSLYREYLLLCQPANDANLMQASSAVWLFDSHSHWDTVEIGQTVQILFGKNHPNDMRLASSGILESPYIGLESWGFWALVIGIIMTWFGWRKLAGPLFARLRRRWVIGER